MATNGRKAQVVGYARQAITTRYAGPTDSRGSRAIVRSSSGHRLTVSWDDTLDSFENHAAAAMKLAAKLEWFGNWTPGATESGYVFCVVAR